MGQSAWRTLPADDYDVILKDVKNYKPQKGDSLRILLVGPVGAGKSSFINSVNSLLQGRMTLLAPTDAISGTSFTKKYKTYKMKKPGSGDYSFVFNDIMGLEKGDGGVHVEELMLAMEGHVEEGYEFTSAHQLKEGDPGYQPNPTLADKVHVLVFVVPVPSVDLIDEKLVKKMREVRLAAADLGIPQMAILTKPDEFCEKVKSNPENVYWSTRIKEQVDKFHLLLGLQENAIFPVKNFSSEITPTKAINMQILFPLQMMINLGEDYLNSL